MYNLSIYCNSALCHTYFDTPTAPENRARDKIPTQRTGHNVNKQNHGTQIRNRRNLNQYSYNIKTRKEKSWV